MTVTWTIDDDPLVQWSITEPAIVNWEVVPDPVTTWVLDEDPTTTWTFVDDDGPSFTVGGPVDVSFTVGGDPDVSWNLTQTNVSFGGVGSTPTGAAGGVLAGTYPNPSFAQDMATQAELDATTAAAVDGADLHGLTLAAGRAYRQTSSTRTHTKADLTAAGLTIWIDGSASGFAQIGGDLYAFCPRGSPTPGIVRTKVVGNDLTTEAHFAPVTGATHAFTHGGPIYQYGATLACIVHMEWDADVDYQSLGVARSLDGGDTWTYCGEIIRPNQTFAQFQANSTPSGNAAGGPGPLVVHDGYVYVFFNDYFGPSGTLINLTVARCTVAAFEAAVTAGTAPAFSKFTYGGVWTEPGIGGVSIDIYPMLDLQHYVHPQGFDVVLTEDGRWLLMFTNDRVDPEQEQTAWQRFAVTSPDATSFTREHFYPATNALPGENLYHTIYSGDPANPKVVGSKFKGWSIRAPGSVLSQFRWDDAELRHDRYSIAVRPAMQRDIVQAIGIGAVDGTTLESYDPYGEPFTFNLTRGQRLYLAYDNGTPNERGLYTVDDDGTWLRDDQQPSKGDLIRLDVPGSIFDNSVVQIKGDGLPIPINDAWIKGVIAATAYNTFLFDAAGTNEANYYNDWDILYGVMQNIAGPKYVVFLDDTTLDAAAGAVIGAYDLTDVTLLGNGIPYSSSSINCVYLTLPTGFTITNTTLKIGGSLVVESTSINPIITGDGTTNIIIRVEDASDIATTSAPFIRLEGTTGTYVCAVTATTASQIHGAAQQWIQIARPVGGYELIEDVSGQFMVFNSSYGSANFDHDLIRSDATAGASGNSFYFSYCPDASVRPPFADRYDTNLDPGTSSAGIGLVVQALSIVFAPQLSAGGAWGGAGDPANLNDAVDRLAVAVSGLLGGPIP